MKPQLELTTYDALSKRDRRKHRRHVAKQNRLIDRYHEEFKQS